MSSNFNEPGVFYQISAQNMLILALVIMMPQLDSFWVPRPNTRQVAGLLRFLLKGGDIIAPVKRLRDDGAAQSAREPGFFGALVCDIVKYGFQAG